MKKLTWDITKLEEYVKTSNSIYEVARKLGLKPWRGNCETINRWIIKKNISKDHFDKTIKYKHILGWNKNQLKPFNELKVLTVAAKRKLKEILGNVCNNCKLNSHWNGQELTLQIDHINGNKLDNQLNNLRVLCPNCHSQTSTYCGRNSRRKK